MKILWSKLKFLSLILRLVKNPNRTELIFEAVDILSNELDQAPVIEIESHLQTHPKFLELFRENYLAPKISKEALKSFLPGTLGYEYRMHLETNQLDPDIFPSFYPRRLIEYLGLRIYQEHDLWHALLGLGVDLEDELALQAFSVAQVRSPFSVLLIAGGLLNLLKSNPGRAVLALDRISQGYHQGQQSKFLLNLKLFNELSRPIAEVREMCRLRGMNAVSA